MSLRTLAILCYAFTSSFRVGLPVYHTSPEANQTLRFQKVRTLLLKRKTTFALETTGHAPSLSTALTFLFSRCERLLTSECVYRPLIFTNDPQGRDLRGWMGGKEMQADLNGLRTNIPIVVFYNFQLASQNSDYRNVAN